MDFANYTPQHFAKLSKFARIPYFCWLNFKNQTKNGVGFKI